MKTYTTRSNAKRAGAALASKFANSIKVLILETEPLEGGFVPSLTIEDKMNSVPTDLLTSALVKSVFVEPEPIAETDIEADNRRPITFNENGDPVDPLKADESSVPSRPRPEYKDIPAGHNHLNKSSVERPCKAVWNIAEKLHAENPATKRKDVLAACVDAGIAYYTARTQYQAWLTICKEMREREAAQAKK